MPKQWLYRYEGRKCSAHSLSEHGSNMHYVLYAIKCTQSATYIVMPVLYVSHSSIYVDIDDVCHDYSIDVAEICATKLYCTEKQITYILRAISPVFYKNY